MRITGIVNYNQYVSYQNNSFKGTKQELLHDIAHDVGGTLTGLKRLEELGNAKTEIEGWKVAMKMADYGNPVRHAAAFTGASKGAAIGAVLGPVGSVIGGAIGFLAANYICTKVRNKTLDKIADWADK